MTEEIKIYYIVGASSPQFEVLKYSNFPSIRRIVEGENILFVDEYGMRLTCKKTEEGLTAFSSSIHSDPTGILRVIGRMLRISFVNEDHIIE